MSAIRRAPADLAREAECDGTIVPRQLGWCLSGFEGWQTPIALQRRIPEGSNAHKSPEHLEPGTLNDL